MIRRLFFCFLLGVSATLLPIDVQAQESSASFQAVKTAYTVTPEGNVRVRTQYSVSYVGRFSRTWISLERDIAHPIEDVVVTDGKTGTVLRYVSEPLDYLRPASWWQYTYYIKDQEDYIEWYYEVADTDYEWIVEYTLRGAARSDGEYQRFDTWVLGNYPTPLTATDVTVHLPDAISAERVQASLRKNEKDGNVQTLRPTILDDARTLQFQPGNLVANGNLFLSLRWPITRSYYYKEIATTIAVQKDTTLQVQEKQTYAFTGGYHQGWRTIPLNKIDAITDVVVVDGDTGKSLRYSKGKLDKSLSTSWGQYTTYRENGNQIIEWYYDKADKLATWTLQYVVHGGITFSKPADRLYWNIFTDYDVPVEWASTTIGLPEKVRESSVRYTGYRFNEESITQSYEEGIFSFSAYDFSPKEAFTIDISWPHGIIEESAYWWDFIRLYAGYLASAAVILICGISAFIYWIVTEYLPRGRGPIMTHYEPPQHLPPAMAEIICTERLTGKGLAATMVDLAVRGYVTIKEDHRWKPLPYYGRIVLPGSVFFMLLISFAVLLHDRDRGTFSANRILFIILGVLTFFIGRIVYRYWRSHHDYILTLQRPFASDPSLLRYEQKYLSILFGSHKQFETRDLKDGQPRTTFYKQMETLKDSIYEETEQKTHAYAVGFTGKKTRSTIIVLSVYGGIFLFSFLGSSQWLSNQLIVLCLISIVSLSLLYLYIRTETRLNHHGRMLREDWLGFKRYLMVVEKKRYEQLTPDLFERYLSYAMVFGVEKKWAHAFAGMALPMPGWYSGSGAHSSGYSSGSTSGFSATGFSASFSSSFSSSFWGGGAGGGGGSGGGGGGGGGAS